MARGLKTMGKDASLSEKAVQQAGSYQRPRRSRKEPSRRRNPVTVTTVDQRVWRQAKKIAKGDTQRIEVVNFETVVVHNSPTWKKR